MTYKYMYIYIHIYIYIFTYLGEVTERRRRASFDEASNVPTSSSSSSRSFSVLEQPVSTDGDSVRVDADLLTNDAWRGMGFASSAR
jgi:hypothetical protein